MSTSSTFNPLDTFDHVVVLMLENRSFDNLLGYLYRNRQVPKGKSFAGLQDGERINILNHFPLASIVDRKIPPDPGYSILFETHPADNYHLPYPDPGEVYRHVNTQLFEEISQGNLGVAVKKMVAPYNVPERNVSPSMDGFVLDYVNTLAALFRIDKKEVNPDFNHDTINGIMACYTPEMIPVLTGLANDFAVFDHWFCSVPSQTWCNRSFWHAATSGGRVSNFKKWFGYPSKQPTLFNRLHDKGISWGIYSDNVVIQPNKTFKIPGVLVSLTQVIHHFGLPPKGKQNVYPYDRFIKDISENRLPTYSFIEPRFFKPHNDMHPSPYEGGLDSDIFGSSEVGSVLLGEQLISNVYEIIRNSSYQDKTLFIITFDEHGGCYDHVPPPAAIPPGDTGIELEDGFQFNRLGVRVPMIMISSHIAPGTIENNIYDHTSFLRTMGEKWGFEPLTERDANAISFKKVFTPESRPWPSAKKPADRAGIKRTLDDYDNSPPTELLRSIINGVQTIQNIDALEKRETPIPKPAIRTQRDAKKYFSELTDSPVLKTFN